MEPYFLDKHLKYKSKITEDFYLFVQPVSSEHNFDGRKRRGLGYATHQCEIKAQLECDSL